MKDKNFTRIPKELQPWDGFTRDTMAVRITVDKRRYGKNVTIIEGIDPKMEDVDDIAKQLKRKVASGGTVKEGRIIELQGDHRDSVKKYLESIGFKTEVVG
jgi:translation initiation factor 1